MQIIWHKLLCILASCKVTNGNPATDEFYTYPAIALFSLKMARIAPPHSPKCALFPMLCTEILKPPENDHRKNIKNKLLGHSRNYVFFCLPS